MKGIKQIMGMMNNPDGIKEQFIKPKLQDAQSFLLENIEHLKEEHECSDDDFVAYFFAKDGEKENELALFVAVMSGDGNIKKPIKKYSAEQTIELLLKSI